ncbi:hypothetical protein N7452_011351 [Penicillium brevicompactum]|uniref:Uncharacterized protein n=1 Tax=Penicillium brevicompactum TaxID=5074 RepID=A0A9W9Q547_PENBR|nr:hypothetical protein N7452_011351 [Penicillium brevicompactum]
MAHRFMVCGSRDHAERILDIRTCGFFVYNSITTTEGQIVWKDQTYFLYRDIHFKHLFTILQFQQFTMTQLRKYEREAAWQLFTHLLVYLQPILPPSREKAAMTTRTDVTWTGPSSMIPELHSP